MRFGEMIKRARKNRFSQQTLGERIGVWGTYIGQIEKGERVPSDERCIQLAEALELDATRLLIAAYRERAQTQEAQKLFQQMEQLITDPVISQVLDRKILDANIVKALSEPAIRQALKDRQWRDALKEGVATSNRGLPELVQIASKLSPQQWEAVLNTAKAFAGVT